jgi:hypothetical protein
MISPLVATRTEHSVCLWHPVVAYLSRTNTIGALLEPVKVSTPNTAKQIHSFNATDCYSFTALSRRFFAVCAGNIHIAYTPSFVWIESLESNSLNKGCQSHFSYNLKHHLACPPVRHHRFRGCKKCCSLDFIITSPLTISPYARKSRYTLLRCLL